MRTLFLASAAALGLMSTCAAAQTTVGTGTSASTPQGSAAGGVTAGTAGQMQKRRDQKPDTRRDRRDAPPTANSTSTYGSGTIYTDRNRATGGVTSGASAAGTGSQSTSTSIDAYGSTDKTGSTAEVYGDSAAQSKTPPVRRPR